jgi:hypothetical protein
LSSFLEEIYHSRPTIDFAKAFNRKIQGIPKDGQTSKHAGRFSAFRATSRAGITKGRKIALPALLYSRSAALESLLSVALPSARHFDSITPFLLTKTTVHFSTDNGSLFRFEQFTFQV